MVGVGPSQEAIPQVLRMTAGVLGHAGGVIVDGAQRANQYFDLFVKVQHSIWNSTWGLLTICFMVAVVHENYQAVAQERAPKLLPVFMRLGAVLVLFLGYDHVCGLLFRIVGAAGKDWMSWTDVKDMIGNGRLNPLNYDYAEAGFDLEAIGKSLLFLALWLLMMTAILFAFVVGSVLSMLQSAFITILIAVGPICIVVSMVPGVGVGKGWAKALGMTAAWSIVGGIITSLLAGQIPDLVGYVRAADVAGMLRGSAQFIIIGIGMLSVPKITDSLWAGASAPIGGVVGAVRSAQQGATGFVSGAWSDHKKEKAKQEQDRQRQQREEGGGLRPHKVSMGRAVGSAMLGAALAPFALAVGREPGSDRPGSPRGSAGGRGHGGAKGSIPSVDFWKGESALPVVPLAKQPAPPAGSAAAALMSNDPSLSPAKAMARADAGAYNAQFAAARVGGSREDFGAVCDGMSKDAHEQGRLGAYGREYRDELGAATRGEYKEAWKAILRREEANGGAGGAAVAGGAGGAARGLAGPSGGSLEGGPAKAASHSEGKAARPSEPPVGQGAAPQKPEGWAAQRAAASSSPEAHASTAAADGPSSAPRPAARSSRDEGPVDPPTEAMTVRQYPSDAETPLALREVKVSPHVFRRPGTVEEKEHV